MGHFSDLAASLIVRPARSCVCRHQCMPRKSPQASERCGLPDTAASIGWLFAWPLLSGSLSAATAPAGIARHRQQPPSRGAPWCWLWSRDPRGEMPVPVLSGLKPCTRGGVGGWGVKTQNLGREHHLTRDQPKGDLSFIVVFFFP